MPDNGFILNVNDGVDTIHRTKNLTESCNTDDIEGRQNIDAATAAKMIASGQAVTCDHCLDRPNDGE